MTALDASPLTAVSIMSGALVAGYWLVALFFLRFWRDTRDRLFGAFSAAFWLLGLQRLGLAFALAHEQETTWLYLLRLVAFVVILWAIVDKNRR